MSLVPASARAAIGLLLRLLALSLFCAVSAHGAADPPGSIGTATVSGEDLDHDGVFDVFEDFNHNGLLDPGEDVDGDGRLTPAGGCEGATREDQDCDGHLDAFDEDFNGNGVLDFGEDLDHDGRLDRGTEDRNHDFMLNDRPRPQPSDVIIEYLPDGGTRRPPPTYPYGTFAPRPDPGGRG